MNNKSVFFTNCGSVSIRRRDDGRWEGRYFVDGVRKSVYAPTKSELKKKLLQVSNDTDTPAEDTTCKEESVKDVLLVSQWMETWFENFVNVKKTTRQRYEIDLRLHINPRIGSMPIADVSLLDIQQLYRALIDEGLSAKSVKNIHSLLHSAFEKAYQMEYIKKNITEACELPKIVKKEMNTLADDRLRAFLEEAQNDEFYPAFYVDIFTGMRESELLGLTWDCISFERNTIRIYRQFRRHNYHNEESIWEFSSLKNDKERTIVVADQVMEMLRHVKETQEKQKKEMGSKWQNRQQFVFTKQNGAFIQTSHLYRHFKRIVEKMGCPNVRFHDLRHTYATIAIQSGIDIKTISSNLGHSTVAFTMDQYAHVSEGMKRKSANKMTLFIDDVKNGLI